MQTLKWMMENKVAMYLNFLFNECLVMKKRSWSVWYQGEDIEKVRKDQGRIETKTLLHQVTT